MKAPAWKTADGRLTWAGRMNGALGAIFVVAGVGLFLPAPWHQFAFGLVLVLCCVGLFDPAEYRAARGPEAIDRAAARELWGLDPTEWPDWRCGSCGQQNAGWALECGRCDQPRTADAVYD